MMQSPSCLSICQRNLSGLLFLTRVVYTSFCHKHLEEAIEQGSYHKVEGIVQG
jgi:hypothetical protein